MNIGESDLNLAFTLNNYISLAIKDTTKTVKPERDDHPDVQTDSHGRSCSEKNRIRPGVKAKSMSDPDGLLPGFDMSANVSIGKLRDGENSILRTSAARSPRRRGL